MNDACVAILSLELDVTPGLLAQCGGVLHEGAMEKEGQLNTSFQERYFVLWPREECQLVTRGFRVLYYFDSRSASKAKGRIRIDRPGIEDLAKEREGECVIRISPGRDAGEQAERLQDITLESFLESRKLAPLDARPLTLRWLSSDREHDFEQMERWSAAFGGRWAEPVESTPMNALRHTSKSRADACKTEVMTSARQQRMYQYEAGMSDQEIPAGTRIYVEGYGVGVYERFEKSVFGGNSHFVRFRQDVTALELPKLRWAILDENEDGSELELQWRETTAPSGLTTDPTELSASTGSEMDMAPHLEVESGLKKEQQQRQQRQQEEEEQEEEREQEQKSVQVDPLPPRGLCWKRKQNFGSAWPERYIELSHGKPHGKPQMGLYVFDKAGDEEPRGSSIENLLDFEVTKGIESWNKLQGGDKFKLTLSAERFPEREACFCFEDEGVRNKFYDACVNLAAGRPWHFPASQIALGKGTEEEPNRHAISPQMQ